MAVARISDIPVGETNPDSDGNPLYKINNDYLYPRYTSPAMLSGMNRATIVNNNAGAVVGPFQSMGLIRGWIYPCDVDSEAFVVASGLANEEDQLAISDVMDDLAAEEAQRAVDAMNATVITGLFLGEEELPASLQNALRTSVQPVGLTSTPLNHGDTTTGPKKIRYGEGKQFQFNPFSVALQINFNQAAAPEETRQQGGTDSQSQVGMASSGVEMLFDRSMEVSAASRGVKKVNGQTIDPLFADIGVQKDIWDVYRIILGGDAEYFSNVGSNLVNIDVAHGMEVRAGSVTDMTNRLFDLGLSGSSAWGRPVAIYYNPNLVIIGWVNAMGVIYAEFNANYVPTKAKMDIGLTVLHTTSESGADAFLATDNGTNPAPAADPAETPNANANSNSSSSSNSNRSNIVPNSSNTYTVTGTNVSYTAV